MERLKILMSEIINQKVDFKKPKEKKDNTYHDRRPERNLLELEGISFSQGFFFFCTKNSSVTNKERTHNTERLDGEPTQTVALTFI